VSWPIRGLGALLALVTVAGGLSLVMTGVVWLDGIQLERHVSRTVATGPAPVVTVNVAGADVRVEAGPPGTVSVQQEVAARGLTRDIAERAVQALTAGVSKAAVGDAVAVSADLSPCCFTSAVVVESNDAVVVRLPAGATLRVTTASGDVEVGALSGPIAISTVSGTVALSGVTASDSLRARSLSGDIRFSGQVRGGSLDLASNSGDISLRLPPDTGASLAATTDSGTVTVDPVWPIFHSGQSAVGTLGQQANGSIKLATVSGNISIGT